MVDVLFLVLYKYNSLNLYKNSTRRVMSLSSISDEDTEAQKVLETCPQLLRFEWWSHDLSQKVLHQRKLGQLFTLGATSRTACGLCLEGGAARSGPVDEYNLSPPAPQGSSRVEEEGDSTSYSILFYFLLEGQF